MADKPVFVDLISEATRQTRRRFCRVASLMISTNSGLSAITGSLARRHAFRKRPVCAPPLNEAFPKRFELEGTRGLFS